MYKDIDSSHPENACIWRDIYFFQITPKPGFPLNILLLYLCQEYNTIILLLSPFNLRIFTYCFRGVFKIRPALLVDSLVLVQHAVVHDEGDQTVDHLRLALLVVAVLLDLLAAGLLELEAEVVVLSHR